MIAVMSQLRNVEELLKASKELRAVRSVITLSIQQSVDEKN